MNPPVYSFDGSFYGLLTTLFEAYERRHKQIALFCRQHAPLGMFEQPVWIETDRTKAQRVWKGLQQKLSAAHQQDFYNAFLSEKAEVFQQLFRYAVYVFDHPIGADHNFGHEDVLAITQMAKKVRRERHRMKAFIRFRKSDDQLFFAVIRPDYNVLPLIISHFRNRYADQPWLIYDEQRRYGMYYDLESVQEVTLAAHERRALTPSGVILPDEKEALYAELWKDYFKSTNISERKNLRLHIQHVPKRYWKYLTEKELPGSF